MSTDFIEGLEMRRLKTKRNVFFHNAEFLYVIIRRHFNCLAFSFQTKTDTLIIRFDITFMDRLDTVLVQSRHSSSVCLLASSLKWSFPADRDVIIIVISQRLKWNLTEKKGKKVNIKTDPPTPESKLLFSLPIFAGRDVPFISTKWAVWLCNSLVKIWDIFLKLFQAFLYSFFCHENLKKQSATLAGSMQNAWIPPLLGEIPHWCSSSRRFSWWRDCRTRTEE